MDLMWKTLLALFLIVCRLKLSVSTILESIYWNTSNTKFVPGKGITLYPQIGDKMDIVCPRLRPGQSASTRIEYFRVYLVTQEQLESCRVAKGNVALLNCDKPDQDVKFTFKFQEFSPNLWGLEFLKGKDYHVIYGCGHSVFDYVFMSRRPDRDGVCLCPLGVDLEGEEAPVDKLELN